MISIIQYTKELLKNRYSISHLLASIMLNFLLEYVIFSVEVPFNARTASRVACQEPPAQGLGTEVGLWAEGLGRAWAFSLDGLKEPSP